MSNTTHVAQRIWLAGFALLGILLGVTGSLLVSWQYQLAADERMIGLHFLALNLGYLGAAQVVRKRLGATSIRMLCVVACALSCAGLLAMSFVDPPAWDGWRIACLLAVGAAAGVLATALLASAAANAASMARTGALFGMGCCFATLVVGACYASGHPMADTQILAAVAAAVGFLFLSTRERVSANRQEVSANAQRTHRLAAVLFSLLLFFQFGNEWAIAGWLPIFLIRRLGTNPALAIFDLAIYFLLLVVGRWISKFFLGLVSHKRLLLGSVVLAMVGYLLLGNATSISGAYTGIVLVGLGFGPIYPLVSESLQNRFPYRPGFYNGVVSIGIAGAMSAPWLLGYVCHAFGIGYAMAVPAFGSVAVCLLVLSLFLEARLMGGSGQRARGELLY